MKIFGREPVSWIGVIGALLATLAAVQNPWVDAAQAAAIVAVLTAVTMAYATRPMRWLYRSTLIGPNFACAGSVLTPKNSIASNTPAQRERKRATTSMGWPETRPRSLPSSFCR